MRIPAQKPWSIFSEQSRDDVAGLASVLIKYLIFFKASGRPALLALSQVTSTIFPADADAEIDAEIEIDNMVNKTAKIALINFKTFLNLVTTRKSLNFIPHSRQGALKIY
jgi:hypothetical protein